MSKIFLITAPSGAGKTTLAQSIAKYGDWTECISHTTRAMREGEVEGKTYYFVDDKEFRRMLVDGEFAESVTYNNKGYGITKAEIERVTKTGRDVFVIVEYDGFMQVKQQYPDSVGIFLHMTKEDCLANMLLRGDKINDALERISFYDEEMKNSIGYEYVVKNVRGKQTETENVIRAIIRQYRDFFIDTTPMSVKGLSQTTVSNEGIVWK